MTRTLLLLATVFATAGLRAQINYTGTGYVQNFDTLEGVTNNTTNLAWVDNVTLRGWYATATTYTATSGTLGGAAANFDDTSVAGNAGLFSFGTGGSNERALGSRAATGAPVRFGLRLVNMTGQTITRFSIAYYGEQWFKSSATAAQSLTVDYQIGATGLEGGTWTGVAALSFASPLTTPAAPAVVNGNAANGRGSRVATVTGVTWAPGQELWIRFNDLDDAGADHGLAIDDFAFWTGDDGGLYLNGVNSYVTMGVARPLGLSVFTIECWFLRTGAGATTNTGSGGVTGVPLVTKGRGESDGSNVDCDYFLGIDASGRLIADFESAPAPGITAGQNYPVTGNAVVPIGIWNHAAVTYDGTRWQLYLNGELDATAEPPTGASPRGDSIQHFGIGTAMTSTGAAAGFFQGVIDEVRVWNVARSVEEILQTRDVPVPASARGLVARYALDEGSGTSVAGQVTGAPAGTLIGGPAWGTGRRLVPNVPPTVALTSPTAAYTGMFPATVSFAATAADSDGMVVKVEFFAGTTKIAEVAEPPYAFEWKNVPAGTYALTAVATDHSGGRTVSAPVTITVDPNPNRAPTLALGSPAAVATGLGTTASLSVTLADPENAATRVTFYGRKTVPTTPGPDFVIGTLPDTQYYSENINGRSASFYAQTNWYLENRDALNIAFVSHMGDIVEHGDNNTVADNRAEWLIADAAMKIIENPATAFRAYGLPWGGAPGNHDQSPNGSAAGTTTYYNQFFGVSRFAGRNYYGGHYGTNNNNNYQLFSASGLDFIILHLEYDVRARSFYQPVLDWADALLKAHPQRRAIVTSHWVVNTGNPATFSAQGQAIYEQLKSNPNLFMLWGGHVAGEGRRADTYQGRAVYSILQDYQGRTNGGDGWLRYYVFSPARNTITAKTFSPVLNRAESDSDSEFTMAYDMQSPVTDWIPLGTVGVPAGGTSATLDWTGLERGAHYEWYAEVRDEINTTAAPARRFVTANATPPTIALTTPTAAARFNLPTSIQLTANASAATNTATIARVEFYSGDTKLGEDTTAPYEFTWSRAISGEHLLTAVAIDSTGASALSRVVPITIANPNNRPPSAVLTAPRSARSLTPISTTLGADVADTDGVVMKVEFFANATKLGERVLPPYTLDWASIPQGNYALTVRATDNDGGVTTSAPVAFVVVEPIFDALIPRNAIWKYLDDGSDPGTAWRAPGFDDSTWASGAAELGYGEGDEATVVGFGNPASRAVTTYFRRTFTVAEPARVGELLLNILRDDGAIVYLNGTEIGRSGLAAGTNYAYNTLAPTATDGADERTFFPLTFSVDPRTLLVRGTNTLAVEVHQQAIANSDLSFNLELIDRRAPVRFPPSVVLTAPTANAVFNTPGTISLTATATDLDGSIARVEFFDEGERLGTATAAPYGFSWTNPPAGAHVLTAVATDDDGNFIASTPVPIVVRESDPGRFINFSIRTNLGTGTGTLIVGFVTGGAGTSGTKALLLRAIGPSLASFGISDFVPDPNASLYSGTAVVASNDNWSGNAQVTATGAQVGAFPLLDPASRDAAFVNTRAAGPHSLQITAAGNVAGSALAEIYDATAAANLTPATPRLINVSARALVGPGSDVLIAGFVIGGSTERTVLIRGIGPSLSTFGVTNPLADPRLELYRSGNDTPVAGNDDWGGGAALATAFNQVAAFVLPAGSRDAALLVKLAPGAYTARLSAPAGATGVALIDVYEVR